MTDSFTAPIFHKDAAWHSERDGDMQPGWYFWDETWSSAYGPYATEEAARQALKTYAETL